ncbi:MAG: hypothetical protein RI907_548 [Pseudomonadota bacterium]
MAQAATTAAAAASGSDLALPDLNATAPVARAPLPRSTSLGFADTPDWLQPVQGFSVGRLPQNGIRRLADLERMQASVGNGAALNGYLESMSIRGQLIDSTHNYRRDGLPVQGGTRLALDAIDRIEILQGVSGMQSGQSSPGGLVNLVVKRPAGSFRRGDLAVDQHGGILAAVDLGDELNTGGTALAAPVGWRLNVAGERLRPAFDNGDGHRHLLALATDFRLNADTLLEAEVEQQQHSQPGQSAVSMTGNTLPSLSRLAPAFNINAQPWAQPVRTVGTTGSLRLTQQWANGWQGSLHYGNQRLRTDNHAAFGVASASCLMLRQPPCDRFGADGGFAVASYDSLDERRKHEALDAQARGQWQAAGVNHALTGGAMRSLSKRDMPTAAYQLLGFSNLYAPADVPAPNYAPNQVQEIAGERSDELYGRDHLRWGERGHTWLGLRHTRLARTQTLTDQSASTTVHGNYTTAFAALGWQVADRTLARVGWGEGLEVPLARLSTPVQRISNSGEPLPAAKSRQWEGGVQGEAAWGAWGLNLFASTRPETNTLPDAAAPGASRATMDGQSTYRGLEARWQRSWQAYAVDTSWMWLDANRSGSGDARINGRAPVNVPAYALRVSQSYRWAVERGLVGQLDFMQDGPRVADATSGARIPAWWRVDASLRLTQAWGEHTVKWGLRVNNLFDRRAWVQAPQQPGHIYLVPMAPRLIMATASYQY